jgi:hypothetical protein
LVVVSFICALQPTLFPLFVPLNECGIGNAGVVEVFESGIAQSIRLHQLSKSVTSPR